MANFLKSAHKGLVKYRNSPFFKARFIYTKYYETAEIDNSIALFEAFSGDGFSGNPFYLLKEMCSDEKYADIKKYVAVKKSYITSTTELLDRYGIQNVCVVEYYSKEYCLLLAQAKYLINNVAFPAFFIKKEGQVYLNTWHGTPLKSLGRSIQNNPHKIGNVQRNFLMSDYILFPNKYTFEHMRKDYMLEQIFDGKYVLAGYPCNTAFFNETRASEIRNDLELVGKKVVVYMPTWRDSTPNRRNNKAFFYTMHSLYELDKSLDDDIVFYVKLHHLDFGKIDFRDFKKIRPFPREFETYDFLNVADCLVTDYSSVMFDFANKNKEILLYAYDKDEYMNGRSMYFDFNRLPFFSTDNVDDLCQKLNSKFENENLAAFRAEYCEFDNPEASKQLLELLVFGKSGSNMQIINGSDYKNGKENVLLFPGALLKNGITTSFKNLLTAIKDDPDRNYIITFFQKTVEPNKSTVLDFKNFDYIGIQGAKNATLFEAIIQSIYIRLNIKTGLILKIMNRINAREVKRLYPGIDFKYSIHFSGYESKFFMISGAINDCKRLVWVHSNMYAEAEKKQNFHINSLKLGYSQASKIAVVRENLREGLAPYISQSERNKLCVVHNQNDIAGIKTKAELPIEFNDDTFCSVSLSELEAVLDSDREKFINIARFSVEKGLDRLISAFAKYRSETNPDAYLIIVGGYGKEFQKTLELAEELGEGHIIIVKSISNPYPILKKCGAFVLSSHYEGLPMTIIEALILGVPVFSTNIPGPREFLEKGYGTLVEDSENGIAEGFKAYHNGTLKASVEFDAEEFNRNALNEYYSLFND